MKVLSSYDVGTLSTKKTIMYFTMKEQREIHKETTLTALFLLKYFLTVITRKNFVMTDEKAAIATGFSLSRVSSNRRLLENKNLFYVHRATVKGTKWIRYCVGKEAVYCNKYFDKLFGYNTVRDVCRKYSREKVADILAKEKLNQMEVKDIEYLLECYRG